MQSLFNTFAYKKTRSAEVRYLGDLMKRYSPYPQFCGQGMFRKQLHSFSLRVHELADLLLCVDIECS
ncbi:Uncharacterised protein [Chlamydia abortus]|nr:Uncharacterised protein [Chlamydia abortus]